MTDNNFVLTELSPTPLAQQRIELVERKGRGHPDSICDAIAEEVSRALCREYLANFGRVLHHNADKALLVAGRTEPRLGGGRVVEPMRLVLGDRAASSYGERRLNVGEIAEASAKRWLKQNLRFVTPEKHFVFQSELKEGSPELTDIFNRVTIGANDTSAAVGYAPLTETECLVLEAEHWLNSAAFQNQFPEAGEDVKVMGVRRDRKLELTVAIAFVDHYVTDVSTYFRRKQEMSQRLSAHLTSQLHTLDAVSVQLNTLDDSSRGQDGIYLTVLGTSAEGGDCGQVGRGNRVNGLIPLNRPISNEAAAGKNPVSHVGKIYSLLTHHVANHVVQHVPGVTEAYVWMCSQIGQPIDAPIVVAVQVALKKGVKLSDVQPAIEAIVSHEIAGIEQFTKWLIQGEFPVC